jgi:hypothetical protein
MPVDILHHLLFPPYIYPTIRVLREAGYQCYLCPTEKQEGAWSLREMGSTWVGGMGEGPALQDKQLITSRGGGNSLMEQQGRQEEESGMKKRTHHAKST